MKLEKRKDYLFYIFVVFLFSFGHFQESLQANVPLPPNQQSSINKTVSNSATNEAIISPIPQPVSPSDVQNSKTLVNLSGSSAAKMLTSDAQKSVSVPLVNGSKSSDVKTTSADDGSTKANSNSETPIAKSSDSGTTSKVSLPATDKDTKAPTDKEGGIKAAGDKDIDTKTAADKGDKKPATDKDVDAKSSSDKQGNKKPIDVPVLKEAPTTATTSTIPKTVALKPAGAVDGKKKTVSNNPDEDGDLGDDGRPPAPNQQTQDKQEGPGSETYEGGDDADGDPGKDTKKAKQTKEGTKSNSPVLSNKEPVAKQNLLPKTYGEDEPENSHFLAYLLTIGVLCIAAYVIAHNRHKIMALLLEGRQGRRTGRSGSVGAKGVKYKRLQHDDGEGENGVSFSSRDGGRVIY